MDLQYIPIQDRDYMTCLNAIMRSGLALQFVPEEMKTLNMCQKAVEQNIYAFEYVPDHNKINIQNKLQNIPSALKYTPHPPGCFCSKHDDPTPILEIKHTSVCDYYRKNVYGGWKGGCNCASQDNIQPLYSGAKPEYANVLPDDKDFTTSNDETIRLDKERQDEIKEMYIRTYI
jgi:hypothetical protein